MYFHKWYLEIEALVVDCFLEPCDCIHDERFLSRINDVDTAVKEEEAEATCGEQLAKSACHIKWLYFNSDVGEIYENCSWLQIDQSLARQRHFFRCSSGLRTRLSQIGSQSDPSQTNQWYFLFYLESEMRNFESEVGLLRSIKHENIVELVDFKKSQNNFYLFLEYCEGGNLSEYIQEKKKLS